MPEQSDNPNTIPDPLPEMSQDTHDIERRKLIRFPFSAGAKVYDLRSQTRVAGRCSELSLGGCFVDTLSPLAPGSLVRIRIEHDSREFEAEGAISNAHVSMGTGMGIVFTNIASAHQEVLLSWVDRLKDEQPAKPAAATKEPETFSPQDTSIRLVLNELISLLVRKRILTENESSMLLRQLFR